MKNIERRSKDGLGQPLNAHSVHPFGHLGYHFAPARAQIGSSGVHFVNIFLYFLNICVINVKMSMAVIAEMMVPKPGGHRVLQHQEMTRSLRRGTVPHREFHYARVSRLRSIHGTVFSPAQRHQKMTWGLRRGTVFFRHF